MFDADVQGVQRELNNNVENIDLHKFLGSLLTLYNTNWYNQFRTSKFRISQFSQLMYIYIQQYISIHSKTISNN